MKLQKKHALRWLVLGGLFLILMSSSSSQCVKGGDRVVGPTFETEALKDPCETECWNKFVVARYGELKRWRNDLKICQVDPVCIEQANQLHAEILAQLEAELAACSAACRHQQGEGTGGQ